MSEQVNRAGAEALLTSSQPNSGRGEAEPTLKGGMGVFELALTVLAFSAPLATVVAVIPLVIVFDGLGAPLAFALATVVLLLFAVGYTTMSRYVTNSGAFYAYITAGLGKPLGVAASLLAVLGYLLVGLGVTIFAGIITASLVTDTLSGPSVPWWVCSLLLVAVVGVLGYFRIDLSAKVLSVVMLLEIVIVLVFDVVVAADGGPEGRTLQPFAWSSFSSGAVGIAVLFAIISFLGFEATAIFREETRDPETTVPRATYLAVTLIGVFYTVTTWLLIIAFGPSSAVATAESSAPTIFTDALAKFVGSWTRDVLAVLVVTSAIAAMLSVQNILARYSYSLGVDGVAPTVLGRVHPRHGSPSVSSLVVTGVLLAGVVLSSGSDPLVTYALLVGAGGFPLLMLMFLTSVAVVVYFRRRRGDDVDSTAWHTVIAPVLACLGLGAALYYSFMNFVLLTGGVKSTAVLLQVVIWSVFVAGVVLALVYRARRPAVYARIGRQKLLP